MQISGCTTSRNLKKEPLKNYDDCKKEYNELLKDFNKLTELEKDCYKLNQELIKASEINMDLLKQINKEYKTAKTNQVIAIVIASVAVAFLAAGGIVIGVKLNK